MTNEGSEHVFPLSIHYKYEENIIRSLTALPIVPITMVLLLSASAWGQTQERFAMQGVLEIGGTLSFQQITPVNNGKTGGSWSYLNLAPSFGVFVIDGLEVGINPIGVSTMSGAGSTVTQLTFMGFISYNQMTPPGVIFPFIEGQAGYTAQTSGSTISGFSWAGRAGVKVAVVKGGVGGSILACNVLRNSIAKNPVGKHDLERIRRNLAGKRCSQLVRRQQRVEEENDVECVSRLNNVCGNIL
jgi:hypothetical protein